MRSPEFWAKNSIISRFLSPLGFVYGYAVAARSRRIKPVRIDCPVVCVGNLVAGGAGKTPVALAVADRLIELGYAPHFLTRGYGGSITGPQLVDLVRHTATNVGDESILLARQAPTWVSQDRVAGAKAANLAGADVIVMDDGFQNHALRKDLSLVVIDGGYGFGNGRVMPAGPLREFQHDGLLRADAIVVIGSISERTAAILPEDIPVFEASVVPNSKLRYDHSQVLAFAGIGLPDKFYATLLATGIHVIETRSFPDHHHYSAGEIRELKSAASRYGAKLVTTEKDFVRLSPAAAQDVESFPISIEWNDCAAFELFLSQVLDDG